jgi:hypothetical protein
MKRVLGTKNRKPQRTLDDVKGCFDSDLQKKETKKKTQLMLN